MKQLAVAAGCCSALALAATVPAQASSKADLEVKVLAPTTKPLVGNVAHYAVNVVNVGSRQADGVALHIQLPVTHTSPDKFLMGDLANIDGRCTHAGTGLTCNLGRIQRNSGTVVGFDLALPYTSAPLSLTASASTPSAELSLDNNQAELSTSLAYYQYSLSAEPIDITSCTGATLTSFFECTVVPGATQTHNFQLEPNGTVTPAGSRSSVLGSWSQPTPEDFLLEFGSKGNVSATFRGKGVDGGCFEGVTTFTSLQYFAPYRVCPASSGKTAAR
jgi:hypothetical protein